MAGKDPTQEHYDAQRLALADLIQLASECAARELHLTQKLKAATEQADQQLRKQLLEIEPRREEAVAQHVAFRNQSRAKVEQDFADQCRRIQDEHDKARRKIDYEHEAVSTQARQKYNDAKWLADSVLETTSAQLAQECTQALKTVAADRKKIEDATIQGVQAACDFGMSYLVDQPVPEVPKDVASSAWPDHLQSLEKSVHKLTHLSLARLFSGATWLVLGLIVVAAAVAATQPWSLDLANQWQTPAAAGGGAVLGLAIIFLFLFKLSRKQVQVAFSAYRQAAALALGSLDTRAVEHQRAKEQGIAIATAKRNNEIARIERQFTPIFAAADDKHRSLRSKIDKQLQAQTQKLLHARDDAIKLVEQKFAADAKQAAAEIDRQIAHERAVRDASVAAAQKEHDDALADLERRWHAGLRVTRPSDGQTLVAAEFGMFKVDLKRVADSVGASRSTRLVPPPPYIVPGVLATPGRASLMIEHDREGRDAAIALLRASITRLLSTISPGRCKFNLLDPVGLGQSFAGFMHLADYDDSLVGGRIWAEQQQIEQRLADLTDHMETVIQKYLRNEFATIDDYNRQAGQLAEPYRFLVVADFPSGFTEEAMRRLANIATSGARCGVYLLLTYDKRQPVAASLLEDLRRSSNVLRFERGEQVSGDSVYARFAFSPIAELADDPLTELLHRVGEQAKANMRIEVPFSAIAPPDDLLMWSRSAAEDFAVEVGRTGATRLQTFRLGRGVAQHALIAGKTGSGKSTLLNVLITNSCMWYSPDELELYLIDFKRGVEFKPYVTLRLPHARAIAVESDREFGLSVLQRLDAELGRRGEMYRKSGVQDLGGFRRVEPQTRMPRILLVVDEFQELFTEDDKLAHEASLLIDRLVRQGRAFGVHVILGSQTIGGSTTLPRTTMGQMAVRVALQCTEADSQLILGDTNSAARLLCRPGEAIYNDAGGAIENNSPFQVSWLSESDRRAGLERVIGRFKQTGGTPLPLVSFEGNAPADVAGNHELTHLQQVFDSRTEHVASPVAFLGEAVAIKPATQVAMRRRAGCNLLVVGQQAEQAVSVLAWSMRSLAVQSPRDQASFVLLGMDDADESEFALLVKAAKGLPQRVDRVVHRDAASAIVKLSELVAQRQATEDKAPVYLVVNGLQRFRELRKAEDKFSFSLDADEEKKIPPDQALARVLREGPGVGVFTIAWVDTAASLDRMIERAMLREFDHRVLLQMSAADSSLLIDSPVANKLGFFRAVYFSEEQGTIEKFRPYSLQAT